VGAYFYRRVRGAPRPLIALLVVAALLSLAWDMAVPAFQGPDESRHFSYIQHLAETGNTPSVASGTSNSIEQRDALIWLNLETLVGNTLARPAWSTADLGVWHTIEQLMPHGSRSKVVKIPAEDPQAKNPPLYYAAMSIPYRVFVWLPLLKRIFILRLINALCYLATVALMWLIAGELFGPVRWKQTLAAGVVALEPQLAFLSAVINADNLLIALTTGLLLVAIRLVTRGPSMARVLAASVLAAAAVLTLGRGLVTLPVLLVALVVAWIVHRPATRDALMRGGAAVGTIAAAFLAYLLFGRASGSSSLYGGQISELNTRATGGSTFTVGGFLKSIYQFYFQSLARLHPRVGPEYGYNQVFIRTFYGAFGSLEVVFKASVYGALKILSDLGLVGLLAACVARWRRLWQSWPVVLVMLALLGTTLVFLHYVSFRALLDNGGTGPLIVGRYLLPMVGLFGLAITFVVGSLPRRAGPRLAAVILAVAVLLSLAGIGITAVRFYA